MKNVTITLEDAVAHWARVRAARHNTSLSRMLGDLLRAEMLEEDEYAAAQQQFLTQPAVPLQRSGGYPTRDAVHDRRRVR